MDGVNMGCSGKHVEKVTTLRNQQNKLWIAVWLFLNTVDLFLTQFVIQRGLGQEINPFLSNKEAVEFTVVKLGLPLFVVFAVLYARRPEYLKWLSAGLLVVVLYSARWLLL